MRLDAHPVYDCSGCTLQQRVWIAESNIKSRKQHHRLVLSTAGGKLTLYVLWIALLLLGLPGSTAAARPDADQQPVPALEPQAKPLQDPAASISLNVPGTAPIGSDVDFTVTFDNTGADPGYGPIIDLILDTTGADADAGGYHFDGLGTNTISASYLSIAFQTSGPNQNMWILPFDGSGNATHPLMRDASGSYINVSGTPGDTLVVLRLPFGSFTPDQPPAAVSVSVNLDEFADLGTPLSIQARGGFEFGADPLDNWCCGDTGPSTLTGWITRTLTPTLFTLSKTYSGPETEAASGPNFRGFYPMQYTVAVGIAPGQSLTSVVLTDQLPTNLQGFNLISSSPPGAACSPIGAVPGESLTCTFPASVSGSASLTFDFYIPLENSSGARVLDPQSGNDVTACNNAAVSGSWTPLDPRDTGGGVSENPASCEHTLTAKSIALQKSVTNLSGGGTSPGDTLEYSLAVQVSDFFAFDGLIISDIISDGQHLTGTPNLEVVGNTFSLPAASFTAANYDVRCDYTSPGVECTIPDGTPPNSGQTTLTLRLSDELIARGRANGRMIGGCINPAGGSVTPECDTGLPGGYNDGPTYAILRFQTTVLDNFIDDFPSGDPSVDQGDVLGNSATVTGDILDTGTFATTGFDETDGSSAGTSIGTGTLSKSIYALNGSTSLANPVEVKPGDTLTYRIQYALPTSDEENLEFTDYLPLPIFNVADPDDDGTANPWSFDSTVSAAAPAPGVAKFGPADSFYAYTCDPGGTPTGCLAPALTADIANNALNFYYGDFNDPRHLPTTVDLLFTLTVSSEPFADRLFLTNQVHGFEGSTNAGTVASNAIRQIVLTEPVLVSNKAAIWSSNPNAVFDPAATGPVTFLDRTSTPRWSGAINSTNLAAYPIDSNVSFVDAGDIVTFAIVIENTGSSLKGAFDLIIRDDLPSQFQIPGDASGLNLQIYYGNPSYGAIGYTGLGGGPDGTPGTADDLFGGGIELIDPVSGTGVCQAHDPNLGNNIILLTFDLQLKDTVTPGTIVNTESLVNYAGSEGGPNHLAAPQTDTAETSVNGVLVKSLLSSEIENASNARAEAVIGEIATYSITIDVPEGEMPGAAVLDTLDSGLAYLDCLSISASSAISTSIGAGDFSEACSTFINPPVASPGSSVRFSLGDLINSDRDNSVAELINITYRVVVLNTAGNQGGTLLNNGAVLSWTGGSLPAVGAPNLAVIEPTLQVDKSVVVNGSGTSGDAGDPAVYTITLQHAAGSDTDAFEALIQDDLPVAAPGGPSLIDGATLTSVTDSAGLLGPGDFTLSGSDAAGYSLTTSSAFDFPLIPPAGPTPRVVTIVISGNLALAVEPGSFDNTASATWTSLDTDISTPRSAYNANSVERTGSSIGPNDYHTSDRATVNVNATPGKTIVSTSEAHTGNDGTYERLAIGEIVRYRVSVDIPEGTSTALQIRDVLPEGLLLQDPGQVKLSFSADTNITQAGDLAGADNDAIPPTFVLPASRITTSLAANRQTVTFSLGNLVNNDSDPNAETITLEFNALVINSLAGSNDAGDDRNNAFEVIVNGTVLITSSTVQARISEPSITNLNKIAVPATGDAGDVVDYTITFSNAGTANSTTAFDLQLLDTLPGDMALNLSSLSASSAGSCATGLDTTSSSGNTVDVRIASVPAGCAVTVTYSATLNVSVTPAQVLTNDATLTYTSLPGPNGTTGNATGSDTPGASGSDTGERNGSGGQNDYSDSDTAPVTVTDVGPVKSIVNSSVANTLGNDLTIGEIVRYRLAVTIPEGTTPGFSLADTLPAGFTYVGSPKLSFQADADVSEASDLAGADNDALPPTFDLPGGRVSVVGQLVDFSLGDLVNHDSDAGTESVVLEFDVRVNNSANNQNTDLKDNAFNVLVGGADHGTSNIVTATIVEPQLTIVKQALDDTPALGSTITYRITVGNPSASSNAVAYDVEIKDVIPGSPGELTYLGPVLPLPAGWSLDDSAAPALVFSASQLALDETVVLEYQVTLGIPPAVLVGDTFANTAAATWTSLSGTDVNERTGADGPGGALNDYAANSSETITASEVDVTLGKDDGILAAAPGDTVTYSLTITNVGNVDAAGVSLTDTVPNYTTFAGPSGPAAWDCALGAPASSVCTYNVGGLAAGTSVVITFAVDVINPLPVLVDITSNAALVSAANEPVLLQGNNSASHDTPLIAAPDLSIFKDDGVDTVSPGTLLVFTLGYANNGDQDASGVTLSDEVPANTTFQAGSSSPSWSCDDPDGAGPLGPGDPGSSCTYAPGALAAGHGGSVQFALLVDDPFPIGAHRVTNTAVIADDGANGPDQNPVDNTSTDHDNVVTLGNLDMNKNLLATSQSFTDPGDTQLNGTPPVAIGEILTYEIVLNIPPGTISDVQVEDVLDRGLAFVDCISITPSSANLSTTLAGGFNLACTPDSGDPTAGNPQILPEPAASASDEDQGRRIVFTLGNMTNGNGFGGSDETLTIIYTAVVIDNQVNRRGARINNAVHWSWSAGELNETTSEVEIVEPTLTLTKDAAPRVTAPGSPITFTLNIAHAASSNSPAFDLVLTDILPPQLTYVPGTLSCTSGVCSETGGVITGSWDAFDLVETSQVVFEATLGAVRPGERIQNQASLEWTSLPDDNVNTPYALSPFNALAVERRYDPTTPVVFYQAVASVLVGAPELPATGFAPGTRTVLPRNPAQLPLLTLGDLQLGIPSLGIRSTIVGVGTDEAGWDLTWLWNNVGFLQGTAYPTHPGNTVLTGHVVLPSGLPGPFS
ncbi:MAG: hypothetical protein ACK2TX_10565, partial [Anaerolineales bacterium]